jgi:hypothetical protein
MENPAIGAAGGRGLRILTWLQLHPLVACLPVQAVLLFVDLGRFPVWGDEQSSLDRAGGVVPHDTVHPDLYFLLLRSWMAALCGGPCIAGARALSALFAIAATIVLDRCWLRRLDRRTRTWVLVLWTLSPALLLYGRMARSYSAQLLLGLLALYAGSLYARRPALRSLVAYAAASTALLHVHYLPGIAVVAGVATAMARTALARRRPAALWPALAPLLLIAAASAPWVMGMTDAVERVSHHSGYHVVGPLADAGLALVFLAVSFSAGEALPFWLLAALAVLAPLLAIAVWRGVQQRPSWTPFVAPTATIAFIAAYRWVSYAFVAGRLLFLLPFYLMLLVHGARPSARGGAALCAAMALLSLAGIGAYFAQSGFLNKAYVIPTQAIADAIRDRSRDAPATVIVDAYGSDLSAIVPRLPSGTRTLSIADSASAARAAALAAEPGLRQLWFVHGAHDVSPEQWNALVVGAFAERFAVRRTGFAPYSTLDRCLMRLAGWPQQPRYAIELVELNALDQ